MSRKLTAAELQEIERLYPDHLSSEIASIFGVTTGYVYSLAKKKCLKKTLTFKRSTLSNSNRIISDTDIEEIRVLYPFTLTKDIAQKYAVSKSTIYGFATKYGWKKDPNFKLDVARRMAKDLSSSRMGHRFKKGHTPANKGKMISEFMSSDQELRFRKNSFKAGNRPKSYLPIGTEILMLKDGYIKVKIGDPNKWELKHRLVWTKANGAIPKGCNVQFKNGNRQDCSIENLYIISKRDQLKNQNSMYARYPKEIQDNIRVMGYLTRAINKQKQND